MIETWLPNLFVGWGDQLLVVLSPGPGGALILTMATTRGRGAAVTTCLGIATGAVLLASAGVLGHGLGAIALTSRAFLSAYGKARSWVEGALGVFFAFAAFNLATSRT